MSRFQRTLSRTVLLSACLLPLASQASTLYHPASNEAGVVQHLSHFQSTKTRDQVKAEVAQARRDGSLQRMQGNASIDPSAQRKDTGAGRSRADVVGELMSESPAAKLARLQGMSGG